MSKRKSWKEKLLGKSDLPKVAKITRDKHKKWGVGTYVVPAPREVDQMMKKVPQGKLITINEIRQRLAKKHKATISCPMATGVFAWIAAHAADESLGEGKKRITPYWRTLKTGGELNPKYPGGIENLKDLLEAEGHKVIRKGKKYVVSEFEKKLFDRRS